MANKKSDYYVWQEPKQKPYALYIHGFASSAKSGTRTSLARSLDQYEWLAPEITHDPFESLAILNDWAQAFRPALLVGTSMGGMLCLYVDAPEAVKVAVNPSLEMQRTLRQRGYGRHPYLQERENGETEYVIDEPMIQKFVDFRAGRAILPGVRNIGIFSTDDELIGHEGSKRNAAVLEKAGWELFRSDKFGHRCNDQAVKLIIRILSDESH